MIPDKLSVSKMNDNTSLGRNWTIKNNPSIEGETWLCVETFSDVIV